MRAWFMIGAMVLGLIGWWGDQGRTGRGGRVTEGQVTTMIEDDTTPPPTPKPKP